MPIDQALARARAAFDALEQGDPKRVAMRNWLLEFERRRQQLDGGTRLQLPDKRRDFIGERHADPKRPAREAAYAAMETLLAVAWPASNAERQVRKRQKQRHEASLEVATEAAASMIMPFNGSKDVSTDAQCHTVPTTNPAGWTNRFRALPGQVCWNWRSQLSILSMAKTLF